MKWRLLEGNGEAIYEIGVDDSGIFVGLSGADLKSSMKTLSAMAARLGAILTVLREKQVTVSDDEEGRRVAEVLVRRIPEDQQFIDIRVAMLGNADAGKSTLIGVLTRGELDNGRGRARLSLLRHLHEIQTGRTSSVCDEILGFTSTGEVVDYSVARDAAEICEKSSRLITFVDLAGHPKYLKTTISGLTSHLPEFVMLVVSATHGCSAVTREHLGFAVALNLPIFCIITKIDVCKPEVVNRTIESLEQLLKSHCNKVPFRTKSTDDILVAVGKMQYNFVVPIIEISNVHGTNIDILRHLLYMLPPPPAAAPVPPPAPPSLTSTNLSSTSSTASTPSSPTETPLIQRETEFQIDDIFCVPDVGQVVSGLVISGSIKDQDIVKLGPDEAGGFTEVKVSSIHRNRQPCRLVVAGQAAALALALTSTVGNTSGSMTSRSSPGVSHPAIHDQQTLELRKGMVVCERNYVGVNDHVCLEFEAEIYLLYHPSVLSRGFQCTVYMGSIRQTATVVSEVQLTTGGTAQVRLRFMKNPEFVKVNMRLLIRDGKSKGMGHVTALTPFVTSSSSSAIEAADTTIPTVSPVSRADQRRTSSGRKRTSLSS